MTPQIRPTNYTTKNPKLCKVPQRTLQSRRTFKPLNKVPRSTTTQNRCPKGPPSHNTNNYMRRLQVRTGCSKETMHGGASKNLMWGAMKQLRGASEHRTMGVLRDTLDRGPLKHRIWSCIWDNVKDPIRSFRAPFVLT